MDQRVLDQLPGLIELRTYLESLTGLNTLAEGHAKLKEEYTNMLGIDDVYSAEVSSRVMSELEQSITASKQLQDSAADLLSRITADINNIASEVSTKEYFNNNLRISDQTREAWSINEATINSVIIECSDPHIWKYPACCINAQHPVLVEVLRSADLLYLVDCNPDLFTQHIDTSTNRVKTQRLFEFNGMLDLDKYLSRVSQHTRWGIPEGQMAIVLCWHLFERYTLEVMEEQMLNIKKLLRPGGRFIFSVNNASSIAGAKMVSLRSASFANKEMIQDLCQRVGLIFEKWEPIVGVTFALVSARLPGELHSVKTQASRGIIKKS